MQSQTSIELVKLSKLSKSVTSSIIVSKFDVARFARIAKNEPKKLPVIQIGKVSDKLYPISHVAIVDACRNVGVDEILVDIQEFETKRELLIHQMKCHSVDQPINPLKIRDIIDNLCSTGLSVHDALNQILLDDTNFSKMLKIPIIEKAETKLNDFIENTLSEKLPASKLVVPFYAFSKIGKLPEDLQLAGVNDFINLTLVESEMNFSWPTADQISALFKSLVDKRPESDAIVATIDEELPLTQPRSLKKSQNSEKQKTAKSKDASKAKPKQNHDTKTLLKQTKDAIIITNESDGSPEYIINVNEGTAHKVSKSADKKSFTLSSNLAKKIISMPNNVSKHHDTENRILYNKNFSSVSALDSQTKKLKNKSGLKLTLFWSCD